MTLDEVHQGFANGPYTLAQLDAQFGAGRWRPLERFVHAILRETSVRRQW